MESCKFVLVGDETEDNLRFSQIVKRVYGNENVARFLELRHLEPFLADHPNDPIVVCLDLLGFDPKEATDILGRIRLDFPKAVINLYLDRDEYQQRSQELPEDWRTRFEHYYKTFKEKPDIEYEPIVRGSLRPSILEALHNMAYEPIRITPVFKKGLIDGVPGMESPPDKPTAFISYSRKDWPGFVSGLVSGLAQRSQKVWIDQHFIVGGDDWMDAVGQALETCDRLLLVLSPNALSSKYVKMEYRYFFSQDKPIVPILYRQVDQLPFELATLHYVDFSKGDMAYAYTTLLNILSRPRSKSKD